MGDVFNDLPGRKSRKGRKGFNSKKLLLAYLLKLREIIPHDTKLAKKLIENDTYRNVGFVKETLPHMTLYQDLTEINQETFQNNSLKT